MSCRPGDKLHTHTHIVMPRHNHTDHQAIVVRVWKGNKRRLDRYRRRRQRFPVSLPRYGPRSESETLVGELDDTVEKPDPKAKPSNKWIRSSTWSLIDLKAGLTHEDRLNQRVCRKLGRKIKASVKEDR